MAKKINKQELEQLQGFVTKINNGSAQLGNLELQKHALLHAIGEIQQDLGNFQQGLKEKYGEVNIDIKTGKIEANLIK